jgi:outer membrane protein TolC
MLRSAGCDGALLLKRVTVLTLIGLWILAGRQRLEADASPHILTLKKSIEIAFQENPTVKAAREGIEAAEYKRKQAQTGFFPKLSTQYSYTYLNQEPFIKVPVGDTIQPLIVGTQDQYKFSLVLDQPLFTGFALTRTYELAKLGLDLSRVKYDQEMLNLAYKVKEAYFNVLVTRKTRLVAEQSLTQIADHVRVAQSYYDVGLIPLNDLLKSEVELSAAKQNLTRAENRVILAQAHFNTLLRRSLEEGLVIEDLLAYQPFYRTLDDCQQEASRQRPEIREVTTQITMAQKNIDLAKSEYYPQVYFQGTYKKQGDAPNVSGSPYTEPENWDLTAGLRWNFWEWGRTHNLVQEKIKQLGQVKEALIQIQDLVRLEVKEAFTTLKESEKNIAVAEKAIQQAEENFRISEVRYREQVATSLEVIDAQTLLVQAKNNYNQALYAYNLAQSRLVRAMGNWLD